MRFDPIDRTALTTTLVNHLSTALQTGVLVGRGFAPPRGGWANGQPGVGSFQPYTVVRTSRAVTPAPGEPVRIGAALSSWLCSYRLNCFGAMESQAEDTAVQVANAATDLSGPLTLGGVQWTLQQVLLNALGDVIPNNSTDPPYWQTSVDVSLHLSRAQPR